MIDQKKIEEWNERWRFSGPDSRYREKGTAWFEFGRYEDGRIDIANGDHDVFVGVPADAGKEILDLHRAVSSLLSERAELIALLREVQWGSESMCPDCLAHQEGNRGRHFDGCRIAAAIAGAPSSGPSERDRMLSLLRQADQVLAWNGYPETHPVRVGAREFGATAPGATPDPVARNR